MQEAWVYRHRNLGLDGLVVLTPSVNLEQFSKLLGDTSKEDMNPFRGSNYTQRVTNEHQQRWLKRSPAFWEPYQHTMTCHSYLTVMAVDLARFSSVTLGSSSHPEVKGFLARCESTTHYRAPELTCNSQTVIELFCKSYVSIFAYIRTHRCSFESSKNLKEASASLVGWLVIIGILLGWAEGWNSVVP